MNGVINLSVLDGWWAEGYDGENGWAITPHEPHFEADYRNHEEANELLDLLENKVIPSYYDRNSQGYSESWVKMSKASMKSCIPNFNAQRMVRDYIISSYGPASRQHKRLLENDFKGARELAEWKARLNRSWPSVKLRRTGKSAGSLMAGESLKLELAASLGELSAADVVLECLVGTESEHDKFVVHSTIQLKSSGTSEDGLALFELNLEPPLAGLQFYKLRIYPSHPLLSHPFETGHIIWL
jgi:starch phosphorylase